MLELTDEVAHHLTTHHGIISIERLEAAGYTRTSIGKLQRQGILELVLQGAYRLRGVEPSLLAACTAVCTAHPTVAIAGPTAGQLWGFRRLPRQPRVADHGALNDTIHVIAPPGARPTVKRWVQTYRTAAIHDRDVVERPDGIRLTSRPRTALDLARFVEPGDLLSIVEQARRDGGHSIGELRAVAVDWRSPRRRWIELFLSIVDRLLPGGAAESHPEVELGDALAASGVTGLVRQFDIELPGYGAARFDLAVPHLRWAIEVDVFPTHDETQGRLRDAERDRASATLGWTTTRVRASDLGPQLTATTSHLRDLFDELGLRDELR